MEVWCECEEEEGKEKEGWCDGQRKERRERGKDTLLVPHLCMHIVLKECTYSSEQSMTHWASFS